MAEPTGEFGFPSNMKHTNVTVVRKGHYAPKVVFVDGLWGCGKTMLSPIIAALDRVEIISYSFEIEYICSLYYLDKITLDAASMLVRMLTDLKLYHGMMSRDVNFRIGDLSSVFKDARPWRYVRRLFQKGDEAVPDRIMEQRPILNIATHHILGFGEPISDGLRERAVFLEIVRHPLYMIKQQALNMEKLVGDARDFTIYYDYKGKEAPYYLRGWEDEFYAANPTERSVIYIKQLTRLTESRKDVLREKYGVAILTIPFEMFVVDPQPFMRQIESALGTRSTKTTAKMMKKQNVPRTLFADGIGLKIYKRCGWQPPQGGTNHDEHRLRREWVKERVSAEVLRTMDDLCETYEKNHLA